MRRPEFDPREPERSAETGKPTVPEETAPADSDVPEPPNKDEIQPDDDVVPDAGTIEPPD